MLTLFVLVLIFQPGSSNAQRTTALFSPSSVGLDHLDQEQSRRLTQIGGQERALRASIVDVTGGPDVALGHRFHPSGGCRHTGAASGAYRPARGATPLGGHGFLSYCRIRTESGRYRTGANGRGTARGAHLGGARRVRGRARIWSRWPSDESGGSCSHGQGAGPHDRRTQAVACKGPNCYGDSGLPGRRVRSASAWRSDGLSACPGKNGRSETRSALIKDRPHH
ncbi:MAG: hypothetical protein ACI80V_000993 [Rhodothermales bacterium]|jgi:hypothetical protein